MPEMRRVRLARAADPLGHLRGNAVRAVVRRPAAVAQRRPSAFRHAVEPLVPGLPGHVVPRTEFRHGVEVQTKVGEEAFPFVHGCGLQPRHACPRGQGLPWSSVTHVPGLECHLCTRSVPTAPPNTRLKQAATTPVAEAAVAASCNLNTFLSNGLS